MAYTTIFKTKPNEKNKNNFCKRISYLLNEIEIVNTYDDNVIIKGKRMLNFLFKLLPYNSGYIDIDDLLKEANDSYSNIFDLCNLSDSDIWDNELLSNIEIIVNCFYNFKNRQYDFNYSYYHKKDKAFKDIELLFNAIKEFLLSNGYKLAQNEGKLCIVENEVAINIDDVEDEKLKSEIISFYDYKNANDVEEKKKIMLILIGKLESRKKDIDKIFGSKIADMFSNYANNLNLRHDNTTEEYKKYYNKAVADLSTEEIIKWYDYIFAFMVNIYLNLDKVKDINANGGFK